jgi:flavin reductase (DIM6/NTAB) family NADH-FMN oxidoreductase RutF
MLFDPKEMRGRDVYQLLIGSVVPRPIAWVSTIAEDGSLNLAPFSFFMGVCSEPPTIAIGVNNRGRSTHSKKDTLSNLEKHGEFVLNLVTEELAEKMNLTSTEFAPHVDEFAHAGLTALPSQLVIPPRVAEAPIQMECVVDKILYTGQPGNEGGLIMGIVKLWHVSDAVLTENQTIDPSKLHAIGRMGANWYTKTNELFNMPRPPLPEG